MKFYVYRNNKPRLWSLSMLIHVRTKVFQIKPVSLSFFPKINSSIISSNIFNVYLFFLKLPNEIMLKFEDLFITPTLIKIIFEFFFSKSKIKIYLPSFFNIKRLLLFLKFFSAVIILQFSSYRHCCTCLQNKTPTFLYDLWKIRKLFTFLIVLPARTTIPIEPAATRLPDVGVTMVTDVGLYWVKRGNLSTTTT